MLPTLLLLALGTAHSAEPVAAWASALVTGNTVAGLPGRFSAVVPGDHDGCTYQVSGDDESVHLVDVTCTRGDLTRVRAWYAGARGCGPPGALCLLLGDLSVPADPAPHGGDPSFRPGIRLGVTELGVAWSSRRPRVVLLTADAGVVRVARGATDAPSAEGHAPGEPWSLLGWSPLPETAGTATP